MKKEPGVTNVTWVNLEEAYKAAKEAFKNSPEMADAVEPDTMPASFRVKVNDPDKYGEVIDKFASVDLGVDGVLGPAQARQPVVQRAARSPQCGVRAVADTGVSWRCC